MALEDGRFGGPVARGCARAWGPVSARRLARPVDVPLGVRVIAVGGATLGGSGKTPLAIACAREMAAAGARVAFVGHAYRARPRHARFVRIDDPLDEVGDEALAAAAALSDAGVEVVVAAERAAAVGLAARGADILVLDGVAQLAPPARAALALLAVDAHRPWGRTRSVVPCGDLRAPVAALVDACDGIVSIGDPGADPPESGDILGYGTMQDIERGPRSAWHAQVVSAGARFGRDLISWENLARKRIGLLCALARPDRLVRMLADRGVVPTCVFRAPDHGPCSGAVLDRARSAADDLAVDVWLATSKCAPHFRGGGAAGADDADGAARRGAPLGVIEHALALPDDLRERLRRLAAP
jgi:tetraacyldisaccharide 4'-kinase